MEKEIGQKICLECSTPIKGRSDKRFCDDLCRNSFNNRKRQAQAAEDPEFLKVIPKIILSNYHILKSLNIEPLTKVRRSKLERMGFNFGYITSTYTTKNGSVYYFCFDQGYLYINEQNILLVQQDSQVL